MNEFIKYRQEQYKEKLDEYREVLGTLPTDDERLENIILNPSNQTETDFCVSCLSFLNETSLFFEEITETMKKENQCECARTYWEENLDMMVCHHRWHYKQRKEVYKKLLEFRPELASELSAWTKEELKRVLQEPTTEEELNLCIQYTNFLHYEADYLERKNRYLGRLEGRQKLISKLKESDTSDSLLEILLDPQSETELDFCISYFGFQDDLTHLSQNATEGNVKPINPEENESVAAVANFIKALKEGTLTQDECTFLDSTRSTAIVLYELTALEHSNYYGLIHTIAAKSGYDYPPINDYSSFMSSFQNHITLGIDRSNPSLNNSLDEFVVTAKEFHLLYLNGLSYEHEQKNSATNESTAKVKQKKSQENKTSNH